MQKWLRIHEYAYQYQKFVYKVYAKQAPAYLCTYWNLDLSNSVYDGNILEAGSYQRLGIYSGLKWRKLLYLPVFNIEYINPEYSADEEGFFQRNQVSSFWMPTEYNFQPSPWDFVLFTHPFLQKDNRWPIYNIVNFDNSTNTSRTFWKVNLKVTYYIEDQVDAQLSQVCSFFDYSKKIYEATNAEKLFNLLDRSRDLTTLNNFYHSLSGLYFLERH